MTDYGRIVFAEEVAFNALVKGAADIGLTLNPVVGLMYLPTQELTRNFQTACREILKALIVERTPSDEAAIHDEAKP